MPLKTEKSPAAMPGSRYFSCDLYRYAVTVRICLQIVG